MSPSRARGWLATPPGRGAIAIVELVCDDPSRIDRLLEAITGGERVGSGRFAHRTFIDIDDGVVARIAPGHLQLMPHGGPGIVRRLAARLIELEVDWCDHPPHAGFPEASDEFEALMLQTLALASSPAAIAPLLSQPSRWRSLQGPLSADELERSVRLQRLIEPPIVACIGPPNAGKSSLLNALLRDRRALVSDQPGTTRDRITSRLDLDGVVVDWLDTPGLRSATDPIEQAAIDATTDALAEATLLVHLHAPDVDPIPIPEDLAPAAGVLSVGNKSDMTDHDEIRHDASTSAQTGDGVLALARLVRSRLVQDDDLRSEGRWLFHPALTVE